MCSRKERIGRKNLRFARTRKPLSRPAAVVAVGLCLSHLHASMSCAIPCPAMRASSPLPKDTEAPLRVDSKPGAVRRHGIAEYLSVKGEARFCVGQEARSVSGKAKSAKCAAWERLMAGACSRP